MLRHFLKENKSKVISFSVTDFYSPKNLNLTIFLTLKDNAFDHFTLLDYVLA